MPEHSTQPQSSDQVETVAAQPVENTANPSVDAPSVRQARFGPIVAGEAVSHQNPLDLVLDLEVRVTVELGRATLQVRDILELGPGAVVELDKLAGEPVEVLVNNRPYACGEVVVIGDNFGVRVNEITGPGERNWSQR